MKTIPAMSKTLVASVALGIACVFAFGSFNASAADFGRGTRSGDHGRDNDRHDNDRHDNDRWNHNGHDGRYDHHDNNRFGLSLNFGGFNWGGYNRVWNEGYYETVAQRVIVVPERHDRQWIAPEYATSYRGGYPTTVCVHEGYWKNVCIPAVYETRYVKVWHPGCYR